MSHGLVPAIESARRCLDADGELRGFASEDEFRPVAEGMIALVALLNVVQQDDVLEDYFWQVVQKPSLWSILRGLGVTATIMASPEKSVRVTRWPAQLPIAGAAYAMPMRVDVNGSTALLIDVLTTDPSRPLALSAGIVAAAARHPTDPTLRFDVQLLGARRGDDP